MWTPAHVRVVQIQHESPLTHFGSRHEKSPGGDARFQLDPVQARGPAESEMARRPPETAPGSGLPISTLEYQCEIRPRMIVQMIWITLEELVDEHIEREPFPVFQEQIVAFQIGFVVLAIHDHPVAS